MKGTPSFLEQMLNEDQVYLATSQAHRLLQLQDRIKQLSAELEDAQAEYRRVSEDELPETVDEMEWDERKMILDESGDKIKVHLPNGQSIDVADTFHVTIRKAERPAALSWLAENAPSLLSSTLTVSFPRGEEARCETTERILKSAGLNLEVEKEQTIHPSTLSKYVRDALANGQELPDVLGVFNRRVAQVNRRVDA